jgi:hypothetical protein
MIANVVETWHRVLAGERPEALDGLLADDVVHGAFRYTKQVLAGDVAMLEFERQIRQRRRHHPLRHRADGGVPGDDPAPAGHQRRTRADARDARIDAAVAAPP